MFYSHSHSQKDEDNQRILEEEEEVKKEESRKRKAEEEEENRKKFSDAFCVLVEENGDIPLSKEQYENYINSKFRKLTDNRTYACELCVHTDSNKKNIKRHIFKHQEFKVLFRCKNCNQTFTTFDNLRKHKTKGICN